MKAETVNQRDKIAELQQENIALQEKYRRSRQREDRLVLEIKAERWERKRVENEFHELSWMLRRVVAILTG